MTPLLPPPSDDDVAREAEAGLVALEAYLAAHAPEAPVPASAGDRAGDEDVDDEADVDPRPVEPDGETRRVRRLAAEVAEARHLISLQADDAPLYVETRRVRRYRRRAIEAARLHALAQDPAALAYRDARVRRAVTVMSMTAAVIALAASSIGVQASVATALGLEHGTPGWWAAYLVEPALSLPLLAAVGVQAYAAMRGRVVDRRSPEGRRMRRIEAILLTLTLVLNCWPALSGLLSGEVLPLLVHALGPVAACLAVWTLPTLWSLLAALPAPEGAPTVAPTPTPTPLPISANAGGGDRLLAAHRARLRELIASGVLPQRPSATAIRRALGCGTEIAIRLREELRGGAA